MISGDENEVESVELINKGMILVPSVFGNRNYIAVHVNTVQYSKVHKRNVRPKSDIYLGLLPSNLSKSDLKEYINEDEAKKIGVFPIPESGISVKLNTDYTSTIQKISPDAFKRIYKDLELGAGASIYCKNQEGLVKNTDVIKGWGATEEEFKTYFEVNHGISGEISNLEYCNKVKALSNKIIEDLTNNNESISALFFSGIGMFDDPYYAPWLLVNNEIVPNNTKKLIVTTGSGRSKGKYQLVYKLSKER